MMKSSIKNAIIAFFIWGLFPLFFSFTKNIDSLLVTAYRIVWACIILFIVKEEKGFFHLKKDNKEIKNILLSSFMIGLNWFLFIYAVTINDIAQASLGYFIGPLFSILFGLVLFKEKLTPALKCCLFILFITIIKEVFFLSIFPWIAITLGLTFSYYGVLKKEITLLPLTGLYYETLICTPIAIVIIFYKSSHIISFNDHILLFLSGLVTIVPLYFFSQAAQKIQLNQLAFIQYLAPSMHFIFAYFYFDETISFQRLLSFSFIWISCSIYTYNAVKISSSS